MLKKGRLVAQLTIKKRKKYKKSIDKEKVIVYNVITIKKRKEDKTMTNEERALNLIEEMIDYCLNCDGMGYHHEIEENNEITIDEAMMIIKERMEG